MFAPRGLGQRWALLIGGDFACVVATVYGSVALTSHPSFALELAYGPEQVAAMVAVLHLGLMYFQDLYTIDHPRTDAWIAAATIMATLKLAILLGVVTLAMPMLAVGRVFLGAYLMASVVVLVGWRFAANTLFFARYNIGVMALGISECAPALIEELERCSHLGYRFLGIAAFTGADAFVRTPGISTPDTRLPYRRIESIADLSPGIGVDALVVLDPVTDPEVVRKLVQCRVHGTAVFDFESFYERLAGKLPIPFLRDSWLIFAPGFAGAQWRRTLKRLTEILVTITIAILSLPIAILTAIAIRLSSRGPIFYSQERVGLDGATFRVLKFRSMRADAERDIGAIWARRNDPRITWIGRIIRPTRIDELPQLLNVLRGDMSLVGPRPERPEMVARLEAEIPYYQYRHFVRPGLTGWAQVCFSYGANVEDAREKLCYDLYYIKNWSLLFDMQIMLQTTKVVLLGRGAR
ncbi:MAG: sugar transferase [Candidatus Binataceae bacterium]